MVNTFAGANSPVRSSGPALRAKITKNSSAFARALRIAGCARIVEPISESSTNSTRRTGRSGRRSQERTRTNTVATAHSGTPAYRSIARIVSMFMPLRPWSGKSTSPAGRGLETPVRAVRGFTAALTLLRCGANARKTSIFGGFWQKARPKAPLTRYSTERFKERIPPMCRWIAYRGETITLERYVTAPSHSLVVQSKHALEGNAGTNGDGFGLGWYDEQGEEPGLYREVRPAWSDENLRHLCRHIRSHLFFAHVRASTGTPTTRPNCHPFAYGRYLFMHNGQIGDWALIRRRVEALIPDSLYKARIGTTDSEAVFLAILGAGGEIDPVGATMRTLATLSDMVRASGTKDPLRFTSAFADGETLYAFRYSNNDTPNTLYYREAQENVVIVSEPLDTETITTFSCASR